MERRAGDDATRRDGAAAAIFALWRPAAASAQTLDEQQLEQGGLASPASDGWDVSLGIGLAMRPDYDGAKDYRVAPVPLVAIKYDDLLFLGPGGIGVNAIDVQGFRAGPVIGYAAGRQESDDPRLAGLGDIPAALTAGVFASYSYGPFRLSGTLRQAVTDSRDGLVGQLDLGYRGEIIADRLFFTAGPEIDLDDGRDARTYFGVTPEQSASSGLPGYSPHGGVKDVGVTFGLTYRATDHILLRSFASLRQLVGDDAASPIVQSKTQGLLGLGAAYHF